MNKVWRSVLLIDDKCRAGRLWLKNPYRVHQRLLMAWPDTETGRMLWRPETIRGMKALVVQAETKANWLSGFDGLPILLRADQRRINLTFESDTEYQFWLRAAPARTVDGRRTGLVDENMWPEWLSRKGEQHGFEPVQTFMNSVGFVQARPSKHEKPHTLFGVEFSGQLKVTNPTMFAETIRGGIGPGKAYGFGLMLAADKDEEAVA